MKNGVRGFFTNPSRADDCFIPFKSGGFKQYSGTDNIDIIVSNIKKDDYVLVSYYFESMSSTFGYPYISCDNGEIIENHDNYRVDNVPYQITGLRVIKVLNDGDLTIKSNHIIHASTTWVAYVSISSNFEQ